jgi:hypothetical protein
MISFLGFLIFATIIVIGWKDRQSGLRLFQHYVEPAEQGSRADDT